MRNGRSIESNIFDQYIYEADRNGNFESSFNVGILLLDNGYKQGVSYLEKASASGNPLASATLCNIYAKKEFSQYVDFNPNQALEYCILSYRQQYNGTVFHFYSEIMSMYGASIDSEVAARAKATIVTRNQTTVAQRVTDGSEILRPKDYPSKDNSRQMGGRTLAAIEISAQGRVKTCLIAQSTYSYNLDQRACSRLKEVAIFTPAVIDGKPAVQWTTQVVNWVPGAKTQSTAGSVLIQILLGVLGAAL